MEQIISGAWEKISPYKKYLYGSSHSTNRGNSSFSSSLPKKVTARPISSYEQHCPQCEEVFRPTNDPRVLKCSHSFCFQCLNNLVIVTQPEYSQVIKCPTCNQVTILEEDGIKGLPKLSRISSSPPMDDFGSPPKEANDIPPSQRLSQSFENIDLNSDFLKSDPQSENVQSPRSRSSSQNPPELLEDNEFVLLGSKPVGITPQYYVPFTVSKEMCRTFMEQWIGSIWFPPSDLNETKVFQECKPLFVPFYQFDVRTSTEWDCQIGNYDNEGKIEYELKEGKFSNNYNQIITCASEVVNRPLITSLLNTKGSFSSESEFKIQSNPLEFDSNTHLKEEILSVDFDCDYAYELAGRKYVEKGERDFAKSFIKTEYRPEKRGELNVFTTVEHLDYLVILLPVFLSGFSYCGKTYEVMISGNKGIVVGDRPYGTGIIGKFVTDGWEKMRSVYNEKLS